MRDATSRDALRARADGRDRSLRHLSMLLPPSLRRVRRALPRAAALGASLLVAGVLAAQTPGAAPAAIAAPPSGAPPVVTLDNGLQVLVVENHSVPLATAKLVVRTGAMTQHDDEQGVPHLFEHMLFRSYRGTADRPFGLEAAALQAGYNGTTAEEMVTYYLTLPSSGVEEGVSLLAGLVRSPRFGADDLRTERFVVLGEMQRGNSEPQDVLRRAVGQALWGAGWPRKNVIGETAALLSVTPKRLDEIYARHYVPNNAALVVTGDVSTARVVEAARRHFGGWRRREDPFAASPTAAPPPLDSMAVVVITGDVTSVTVLAQWQGPGARADVAATYDADVLADLVADEESGFQQRLVHDGPFQSAHLSYQTLVHTGPISFTGTTTVEQLPGALTALSGELFVMQTEDYFQPRALASAAKRRRAARSFEREEGVSLAHALSYAWATTGLPYHATYADSLAARTPTDLKRFVDGYIGRRPFVIGLLVPTGRDAEVVPMMQQFLQMMKEDGR